MTLPPRTTPTIIGTRKWQQHTSTSVRVCTVISWEIRKLLDDSVRTDVEDLAGLGDEDKQCTIPEQVNEWIHIVRLILCQNVHRDVVALSHATRAEDLVCGIVVR